MRLISWNVAGRVKRCEQQVGLITSRAPDIIALQEVTTKSYSQFEYLLKEHGFNHIIESVQLASELSRRYGELIASRFPLTKLPPSEINIPYQERVLSTTIEAPTGPIELHTAHIPPGSSNGWIKIDTFEGIYNRLAMTSDVPRILCGDFNSPQFEKLDGTIVTWGQKEKPNGEVYIKRNYQRWDAGERSVIEGLTEFDLPDVYRLLNGYGVQDYSWILWRKGRVISRRRFDYIFASRELKPIKCHYLHNFRESGASDHSAIEAVFSPS